MWIMTGSGHFIIFVLNIHVHMEHRAVWLLMLLTVCHSSFLTLPVFHYENYGWTLTSLYCKPLIPVSSCFLFFSGKYASDASLLSNV